jgi:hypothetical protein
MQRKSKYEKGEEEKEIRVRDCIEVSILHHPSIYTS